MKAKGVMDAISELDEHSISGPQKVVLESLIEDVGKMDEKIMALEKRVENLEKKFDEKFDTMQGSIDQLSALVKESINRRQSFWNFLSDLIKEAKFWIWIIIFTVLAYGVSISDLKGLLP